MANTCPAPPAPAVPPVQPAAGQTFAPQPYIHFTNQTLRQIVHTSIGGTTARVVLSNAYGTSSLMIGAASVAVRDKEAAIQPNSSRPLTFSGESTVTITAGAIVYSDPVNVTVPQTGDLAIDLYIPGTTNTPSPLTMHGTALQTNYVSETGNHAGQTTLPVIARTQNWFLLSRVEVAAPNSVGGIVTFGDSITDGTRSTPNLNSRWPDYLMRRLASEPGAPKMGIMNAGISGNRVLGDNVFANMNGLARFDRHALDYSGVTHIVVLLATNDFGGARQSPTPTANDLIAGYRQFITRTHAKGVKIIFGTVNPYYGAAYYSEVGEAKRQALNEWIRTSKEFDGFIDFDKATRDPNNPKMYLPAYDSCDHLHPNDVGYKAMADAIDLKLFASTPAAAPRTSSR
jgi:lysophospholipase L1-like esterase